MIQIYEPGNTNYAMNGDAVLNPITCNLNMILNGAWIAELQHPIDDKIEYLIPNAVISLDIPTGKRQLFRIYEIDKNDDNIVATSYPIFLDSRNDCFLFDVRPTNKNGQDALDIMLASNVKYSARSDIKNIATSYYIQKNFIEALNGDDENSFINRWGGEISYNNFEITVNKQIGSDNGLRAEFGFNLTGVSEKIDMSNVVTRIVPKAFNGYALPDNETVDSKNISKYPVVCTKVIEYPEIKLSDDANEDDENNGSVICYTLEELYTELRNRAKEEYDNGIDLPAITYNVDMIDLSKTDLYDGYENLLNINLGDTVYIKHRRLGITTKARVIELTYDCILNNVESLVLGNYESNYFDDIGSVTESVKDVINTDTNTVMAEKIRGIINLMNTSLKAQKSIAKKQDVRAILFEDLDNESPTFGALSIGTLGIQIARVRNETDTDWKWGTAIDFQTIYADYIIAGILSDREGNNHWDLDKGELVTKNMRAVDGYFSGTVTGSIFKGGKIDGTEINGGTVNGTNINTDKDLTVGNNIRLSPNGRGERTIYLGNNVRVTGQNDTFRVYINDNSMFRALGDTSSVDGTNVQLLASNHVFISGSSISASTNITIGSDKRLKKEIRDIDISSIIDDVEIKSFDYINGRENVIGVIAQDLKDNEFSNYLISCDERGMMSVDYNALAMACIQKVQELDKRVKELEEINNVDFK